MWEYLVFIYALLYASSAEAKLSELRNAGYDCSYCQPEQIHIAFGEKSNDIVVTWSTFNNTGSSIVEYGVKVLDQRAQGSSKLFTDGGHERRKQYIHNTILRDLKHDTVYQYHVGSVFGWSDRLWFRTPPAGDAFVVRAALYGDMGSKNAHSLSYLQREAQAGLYDLILHVGDFAYDMDTDGARVGDEFMRQVQSVAAYLPYMTCPGNHEQAYNFSNYKNRFSMPGGDDMFYSFDLGPVHFVSINTEYYYFLNYGFKMVANQYGWLEDDLRRANEPQNRNRRPWVVLFGHRPMYCSNSDDEDCSVEYTRLGLPLLGMYGLEGLLKRYGVDLVVWAHEHSYERTWPLYDGKVYNGTVQKPYENPGAPVHVVTGSAGCEEDTDRFVRNPPAWSAFRSSDYGYTRLTVHNKTHLYLEQVDVDKKGEVIDRMWLVKDRHEAFTNLP